MRAGISGRSAVLSTFRSARYRRRLSITTRVARMSTTILLAYTLDERFRADARVLGCASRASIETYGIDIIYLLFGTARTYGHKRDRRSIRRPGERFMPLQSPSISRAGGVASGGDRAAGQELIEYQATRRRRITSSEPDEPRSSSRHPGADSTWLSTSQIRGASRSTTPITRRSLKRCFRWSRSRRGNALFSVAHRRTRRANWLDTTGQREGFLTPRWPYSQQPPPDDGPRSAPRWCASTRSGSTMTAGTRNREGEEARREDPRCDMNKCSCATVF